MSPPTDLFFELTPDKVLDAVEVSGLRATGRALALNSYENRVYDVELEDGSHRVLKFYRPGRWSKAAIEEEHRFLADLAAEGMPVCAPEVLRAPGETLLEVAGILYASFPKIRGRLLQSDEVSEDALRTIGHLLARLHNVGAAAGAPERGRFLPGSYALDEVAYLCQRWIPMELAGRYKKAAAAIGQAAAPIAEVPPVRIHGDCHLGNLLYTSAGPCFVDFDDFLLGPPVQDLWLLCDGEPGRLEAVRAGYEGLRHLERGSLGLIEALRGLRMIRYAAWIGRRYHDPAFPRAFPAYADHEHWAAAVDDLERQVARLTAPPG